MSRNSEAQGKSFLLDIGTIITLLAALLYTAGWSFAYHYYEHFHLGLIGLDIPKEYFIVYSFWVIKGELFFAFAALVVTVLLYFMVRLCFQKAGKGPKSRKLNEKRGVSRGNQGFFLALGLFLTPIVILSMFWQFYYLGNQCAASLFEKQVREDFPSYPRVKVWLTEEALEGMKPRTEEWANGCYRLLLRGKEHLYLFYPEGKSPTEIIPQSNVKAVRVLPQYHSCSE